MSRFLFASSPQSGHFNPATGIAHRLAQSGHEVGWYTGQRYQAKVEALGARFFPMQAAPDFHENDIDATFPGRTALKGLAQLKWDIKHIFIDSGVGQLADLAETLREFPADVLVPDPTMLGAYFLQEKGGPPVATYGILQLTFLNPDYPPMGLGLMPDASPLGPWRNRFLNWLVSAVLFRDVQAYADQVRAGLGLPPLPCFVFDLPAYLSHLYLQGTTPAFEFPIRNLPPQIHFIGPLLPQAPASFTPPDWWDDLNCGKPVVLVTQGVIALDYHHLLVPAIQALADQDVLIVATTGGKPIESVGLDALPANVRLAPFIPYHHLLPHVDVMVTNGGYGGTQFALSHGVPLVVAGISEGKIDICARVEWSGAGVNLHTETPTRAQIRSAVNHVLADPSYRTNARRIQVDFARHDAPAEAVQLLEKLATTRQPVLRPDAVRETTRLFGRPATVKQAI